MVDPELYKLYRCTSLAEQFEIYNVFFWPGEGVCNDASIPTSSPVLEELAVNLTSTVLVGMRSSRSLLQVDRPAFSPWRNYNTRSADGVIFRGITTAAAKRVGLDVHVEHPSCRGFQGSWEDIILRRQFFV